VKKNFLSIDNLLQARDENPGITAMDSAGVARIAADQGKWRPASMKAEREAERYYRRMRTNKSLLENHIRTINKFAVEIHKKVSIPFASIVFVLVGAPLGIMARRGSMGVAISLSIGFFLLFWVFLIGGEDLADRKIMPPSLAMWAPNIIVGAAGLYLTWKTVKETSFINWDRLAKLFKRK
jgi:lipopolysaccharide export system permease protein